VLSHRKQMPREQISFERACYCSENRTRLTNNEYRHSFFYEEALEAREATDYVKKQDLYGATFRTIDTYELLTVASHSSSIDRKDMYVF